ncbi:hypothetical protein RB195_006225 [Necator americanus]|uniref:Uncharacterized protein n=1 Tax=Necator americanus TaxID=51031 RepID=A0ABR1BUM1_NECAM
MPQFGSPVNNTYTTDSEHNSSTSGIRRYTQGGRKPGRSCSADDSPPASANAGGSSAGRRPESLCVSADRYVTTRPCCSSAATATRWSSDGG